MSSWGRTARAKRRQEGGASVGKSLSPNPGKESSYVLLGEDRLSEAKARRGSLHWREPRPQ